MDNRQLRQLYQKYQKEIYLYLYSLCKNRDLAEDLVQETFLKAILSLPDDHTNMRAWLYMVARNLYFNHRKKESKNVSLEDIGNNLVDDMSSEVLQHLLLDERRQILYQALQHLNESKREILVLQYFGGLSQKEIAALLRKTPENIRILAHRGKKELREYMEANGYDIS